MVSSAFANRASKTILRRGIGRTRQAAGSVTRDISIGTDLADSEITLQKARPWHMNDKDSNLAEDNAVTMSNLFKGKKVAFFGVPAPFTGTCTASHYPPYQQLQDEFRSKGVDAVVCYSVSDPYAHYNWGKAMGNDFEKISFLADVDCEWAKSHDLDRNYNDSSLGHRSARFSMVVEDGIVKSFNLVEEADKDAQTLLEQV
jgi:peroxiredoxin